MPKQIVYAAHTPSRVWDELNEYAIQTRIRLEVRCPACAGELKHTHNDVHCDACDAPVSFFQQRHLSDDVDTRGIYIQVKGHEKEIHRLNLHCLSCEAGLNAEELCPNTCEIQTLLIIETDDDQLYVKRWFVRYLYNDSRPTTEIPLISSVPHNPVKPPEKDDVQPSTLTNEDKILIWLRDPSTPSDAQKTMTYDQIAAAVGLPRTTVYRLLRKLVEKEGGRVEAFDQQRKDFQARRTGRLTALDIEILKAFRYSNVSYALCAEELDVSISAIEKQCKRLELTCRDLGRRGFWINEYKRRRIRRTVKMEYAKGLNLRQKNYEKK